MQFPYTIFHAKFVLLKPKEMRNRLGQIRWMIVMIILLAWKFQVWETAERFSNPIGHSTKQHVKNQTLLHAKHPKLVRYKIKGSTPELKEAMTPCALFRF